MSGTAEPTNVRANRRQPSLCALVERLEHEREGGGAPSTRAGKRSGTLGARLWQSLLHPVHLPNIWRRGSARVVNVANIKLDLPRVHLAGSDAHHHAHFEVGPHGFALFLSQDAEYPLLDIDGTLTQLGDLVGGLAERGLGFADVGEYPLTLRSRASDERGRRRNTHMRSDSPYQTVCGTFTSLAASGSSIVKMQPFPGMLRTWMSPAFARTACRAIASPRPRPERSAPRRSPKG
jgi:hypothetical protein